MRVKHLLISIFFILVLPFSLSAERSFFDDLEMSDLWLDFSQVGPVYLPTYLSITFDYYGVNINPDVDTIFFLDTYGGRRHNTYFYDNLGNPMGAPSRFNEINYGNRFGIKQGLLWNNKTHRNMLSAYGAISFNWSSFSPRDGDSNLVTSNPNFLESRTHITNIELLTGLLYDDVSTNFHGTREGMKGELYVGFQPFTWNGTTYTKGIPWNIGANYSAYLPLFDLTEEWEDLLFSGELMGRVAIDYLGNYKYASLSKRGSTGGLYARPKLGGLIRGYESRSYDGDLTMSLNTEFRMRGPQIILPNIYPWATVFMDMGYSFYLNNSVPKSSHYLLSLGFEAGLNILDLVQPGIRVSFPLTETRMDSKKVAVDFMLVFHL